MGQAAYNYNEVRRRGDKELRTPREATFQGSHTKTDREQIDILKIFKLLHERFWMIRTESSRS